MHTRENLTQDLDKMQIDRYGTLLVHSSMKSIGHVNGGADTVLDVLIDYMENGLLVLPTHSWSYINTRNPKFHVHDSPSCVGILTELFRKRPGVVRSYHPTHSLAAIGREAAEFVLGNELCDTPCARNSSWGKLLDRNATIMLIGVDLRKNTFIHGVEEWADIPGRITVEHEQLYTILPDGTQISVPSRRHCGENWSNYFWKVNDIFIKQGIMQTGVFGDAEVRISEAGGTAELLFQMLRRKPDLFSNNEPVGKAFFY